MNQQPNIQIPIGSFPLHGGPSQSHCHATAQSLVPPTHPSQPLPFGTTTACRLAQNLPSPVPRPGALVPNGPNPDASHTHLRQPLPVLLISVSPTTGTTSTFAKHSHTHTHNPDADDCARPPPTSALFPRAPNHVRSCAAEVVAGREDDDVLWGVSEEEAKGGFLFSSFFHHRFMFEQKTECTFGSSPFVLTECSATRASRAAIASDASRSRYASTSLSPRGMFLLN